MTRAAAGRGPLADFTAACMVEEGCPIYVPRQGAIPPKSIAVAWDGSKEASRAAFAGQNSVASVFVVSCARFSPVAAMLLWSSSY